MAEWVERWTGRVQIPLWQLDSLRNFGNSVYPALPLVSFGGDTNIKAVGPFYLVSNASGSK